MPGNFLPQTRSSYCGNSASNAPMLAAAFAAMAIRSPVTSQALTCGSDTATPVAPPAARKLHLSPLGRDGHARNVRDQEQAKQQVRFMAATVTDGAALLGKTGDDAARAILAYVGLRRLCVQEFLDSCRIPAARPARMS